MKRTFLGLVVLIFPLLFASRVLAYAEARAGGRVGDGSSPGVVNSAPVLAIASKHNLFNEGEIDKYNAFAEADNGKLRAIGSVFLQSIDNSASAVAQATWTDALTVDTPDLSNVDQFIYFRPIADGSRSGSGASAAFHVSVYNPLSDEVFAEYLQSTEDSGVSTLQAQLALPLYRFHGPVAFSMTIEARASRATLGSAQSDYSHTAVLPPIFVGDANGNPIPELAGVHIIGESGRAYPVTVVQRTPGDYNGDGTVDAGDYVVWRRTVGQTGLTLNADGNGDQVIDSEDLKTWKVLYGSQAASGASLANQSVVPENTTSSLLLIALCSILLCSRLARFPKSALI